MTINELISTLETIRNEHGNINIAVADCDEYGHYDSPTTQDVSAVYRKNKYNEYVLIEVEF